MNKIVQASFTGRKHLREGTVCQDKIYELNQNGISCVALADGAGSAKYSDTGAKTACHSICHHVAKCFDELIKTDDGMAVKKELLSVIKHELLLISERDAIDIHELATTLLFLAVKDDQFLLFHVGDGVIGVVKHDELKIASWPFNGEFVNATVFVTSEDALENSRLLKGCLEHISGFVMMSDGTAESFYDRRKKSLAPVLKKMIDRNAILDTVEMKSLISESFLEFVVQKTQDDCSIAIISFVKGAENFFDLTSFEKGVMLGYKCINPKNNRQIQLYTTLLRFLDKPKTLDEISKFLFMKPRYAQKKLDRLLEKRVISKEYERYFVE